MSNRIVIAGAGTGKTHKLVQTCIDALKDPQAGVGIDQILIVTFTKAAAAELRERIAKALNDAFAADPASTHLARQIALLDRAQISTIHSFCLDLVSRNFSELGLSPRLATLEPAHASVLESETLDQLLEDCFAERLPMGARVTETILGWFRGDDLEVRRIVQKLYRFSQALADPAGWIQQQRIVCENEQAGHWRNLLGELIQEWVAGWRPPVAAQPDEGNPARVIVLQLLDAALVDATRDNAMRDLASLATAGKDVWPRGSKGKFRDPVKKMYEQAAQLAAWASTPDRDPLKEDWECSRPALATLLDLTSEFAARFADEKRNAGVVDFNDLEQFSLRLLWKNQDEVSEHALACRERFKLIFVDEYQDTNPAQDRIIEAIARPAPNGNRFLVGDVKQSIYGFRHADSRLFQEYEEKWPGGAAGEREYLVHNWRSHERLLDFVNELFTNIMSCETGRVTYDEKARLVFADRPERKHLKASAGDAPRVEVHYIPPGSDEAKESGDDLEEGATGEGLAEFARAEAEAEVLAARFREMVETNPLVLPTGKTAQWGDIVILLRAPSTEVEAFAKVFSRHGIPFEARRAGYFNSIEVLDLINLLTILDNPLQDYPLLGVLRSPIGCFSIEDLAALGAREEASIFAAVRALLGKKCGDVLREKAGRFLERFDRWRKLSQSASLAARLEEILEETAYEDWVLTQPRGEQRRANVRRFVELARQFDALRGEGLFPFLEYLKDHMEEGGLAPPAVESQNAVRLSTIHNSKGLEYPIVALAGLGKTFNEQDFRGSFLIDDLAGLTLRVRPPGSGRQYPSVAYLLASDRQKKRMRDEEMRLLYVAMTRAQFHMLIVARPGRKTQPDQWIQGDPAVSEARSALDWIAPWLAREEPEWLRRDSGAARLFTWRRHAQVSQPPEPLPCEKEGESEARAERLATLRERLEWKYHHAATTRQEAKTSATALRRQSSDEPELAKSLLSLGTATRRNNLRANEAGAALHLFFERAELGALSDEASIAEEVRRLEKANVLTAEQKVAIDGAAIARFWTSPFGREILGQSSNVHRELAFTARFGAADLAAVEAKPRETFGEDEFVVVQGAADLVVLLEKEIWLVDFKTDRIGAEQVGVRVAEYTPQLRIYALALSRIYKRAVTRGCLHFLSTGWTEWVIALETKPGAQAVSLDICR